jgi:X-X-X-Leu-X-X-Gly heptad repeat protein
MSVRSAIAVLAVAAAAVLPAVASGATSYASGAPTYASGATSYTSAATSYGTREQIAWVRRAASNFVAAELSENGAGACSILYAPLTASEHHRTCAQRWDAKLSTMLHEPGARARLREDARAIPSAVVVVHGNSASIDLPTPLMSGTSRLLWSSNCWMLDN